METEVLDYSLFGEILVNPATGETATPTEALKGKVVLLYFSAHWCAPCNKFTPKLHLFNQLQNNKNGKEDFAIVFCSMDRSEEEYKAYSEQMPWWCLPYAISTLPKLAQIYHAHGIPHLVILDTNGKVITKEGVPALQQDPVGRLFPWRPLRVVDLLPELYLDTDNESYLETEELEEKYLMLYFSEHGCGLCQDFTPWLVKAYNILKQRRPDDFEILFVSADASQEEFDKYFADMPWCAIPYEERDVKKALEKRLEITGYPTLLMLGPRPADDEDNFGDRPIINTDVRTVIENGDYISDFPYYPKPWGDLCRSTDDINTHKCLIVFHELGDDEQQEAVEDAVKQAAEDYRGDELIKFYWANDQDAPLAANVRETCATLGLREEPSMVLLDIPDDGAYYLSEETDITPETIKWFLLNKGDRQQI